MASPIGVDLDLLARCESEPIHIPGAIQPFGILLTVEPRTLRIQNASENCAAFMGIEASELIGRELGEFLHPHDIAPVKEYLDQANLSDKLPLTIASGMANQVQSEQWELQAHEHLGVLFLELLPSGRSSVAVDSTSFDHSLKNAVNALSVASNVQALCDVVAQQVKEITGFDRVMVYRFDADWHGVVVAEARGQDIDSYLGQHFPASDIPAQARAIFLQNWLRTIPDVGYIPSKVFPGRHPATGEPLDLGKSLLRSVSPIHLQYLKNMDVGASLTVSLIDEGKLWGLIACHHHSSRLPGAEARNAAQLIGRLASSQLRVKEAEEDLAYKEQIKLLHQQIAWSLGQGPELADGLHKHASDILRLVMAESGAICYQNVWTRIGNAPSVEVMERIVAWLAENMPANGVFHTDSLVRHIPEAAAIQDTASGLLAIQLTKVEKNYLLWFRPEVATTVTWAGRPEKAVVKVNGHDMLQPRASFKAWKEVVEGKALPWKTVEIEAAEQFRNSLLSIALQEEFRKEQIARSRAEQLSLEKDEMVMMVSHDLRTPLSIVAMSFQFLQHVKPSEDKVVQRMIDRGAYGAKTMEALISDILTVSKIESGSMELDLQPENAEEMTQSALDFFMPLANERNIQLAMKRESADHLVMCEKNRMMQVFSNLIGNALKFTPSGGRIDAFVEVAGDQVVFCVADTGPGIPGVQLQRIFDRFWQAQETKQLGTGLGLWISKSIIEKHGGKIWAESAPGAGASFYFSLPIYTKPD